MEGSNSRVRHDRLDIRDFVDFAIHVVDPEVVAHVRGEITGRHLCDDLLSGVRVIVAHSANENMDEPLRAVGMRLDVGRSKVEAAGRPDFAQGAVRALARRQVTERGNELGGHQPGRRRFQRCGRQVAPPEN